MWGARNLRASYSPHGRGLRRSNLGYGVTHAENAWFGSRVNRGKWRGHGLRPGRSGGASVRDAGEDAWQLKLLKLLFRNARHAVTALGSGLPEKVATEASVEASAEAAEKAAADKAAAQVVAATTDGEAYGGDGDSGSKGEAVGCGGGLRAGGPPRV